MAVWRRPEGLGSGAPQAGSRGNLGGGWAHRRRKAPLLEKVRGGGWTARGIYFPGHVHTLGGQGTSDIGCGCCGTTCEGYGLWGPSCAG